MISDLVLPDIFFSSYHDAKHARFESRTNCLQRETSEDCPLRMCRENFSKLSVVATYSSRIRKVSNGKVKHKIITRN